MPVAFDVETAEVGGDSVVTVSGFSHAFGESLVLNTAGRENVDWGRLLYKLENYSGEEVELNIVTTERELLELVASYVNRQIDADRDYLTTFNGKSWNDPFDIPFCGTRFHSHDMAWPFNDLAYADLKELINPLDTNEYSNLDSACDVFIPNGLSDPFDDSEAAVTAFEDGEWLPLLKHNLATIKRSGKLARIASRHWNSDFALEHLQPPRQDL